MPGGMFAATREQVLSRSRSCYTPSLDIDFKKRYLELFNTEMNRLVDLTVKYGATKDNFSVNDFKMYWDRDGISPMVTEFIEEIVKQSDCPDEIKTQAVILRKFW